MSRLPCLTQQPNKLPTQPTILIVEDNPIIQELLVYSFTFFRYHCSIIDARTIASLSWIENTVRTPPDAMVLDIDIHTPVFKGHLGFLHACSESWQRTQIQMLPLVLLTTQAHNQNRLQQEGYTVVTKPFKPGNLLSTVQEVIEQKQEGACSEEKIVPSLYV